MFIIESYISSSSRTKPTLKIHLVGVTNINCSLNKWYNTSLIYGISVIQFISGVKKSHGRGEWSHVELCDGGKVGFVSLMVDTKPIITLGGCINSIRLLEIMMLFTYTNLVVNEDFKNSKVKCSR